jgi:hypothetical protein
MEENQHESHEDLRAIVLREKYRIFRHIRQAV